MIARLLGSAIALIWALFFAYMPFAAQPQGLQLGFNLFNAVFCVGGGYVMLKLIWED